MIAIAQRDVRVSACNCWSKKGNKLRKDRIIKKGETLDVIEFFIANTQFWHGTECVRLTRDDGITLATVKEYFKYEGNTTKKELWELEDKVFELTALIKDKKDVLEILESLETDKEDFKEKENTCLEQRKMIDKFQKKLDVINKKIAEIQKEFI